MRMLSRDRLWELHLRTSPAARVRQGRRETDVLASEPTGADRERLWRLVCDGFPLYASYQRRTARRFPIFVLEPVGHPDVR
jgi:hypothetical protein